MPPTRPVNLLLTFDAFGTLFTPRLPIAAQYALAAQEHGLAGVNEADVRVAFKEGDYPQIQFMPVMPLYTPHEVDAISVILYHQCILVPTETPDT